MFIDDSSFCFSFNGERRRSSLGLGDFVFIERYKIKHISLSLSLCCLVVIYTDIKGEGKLKLRAQREFAFSQMVIEPSFLRSDGEKRRNRDRTKEADSPRDTGSVSCNDKKQLNKAS